jgi:hypothetical protein
MKMVFFRWSNPFHIIIRLKEALQAKDVTWSGSSQQREDRLDTPIPPGSAVNCHPGPAETIEWLVDNSPTTLPVPRRNVYCLFETKPIVSTISRGVYARPFGMRRRDQKSLPLFHS